MCGLCTRALLTRRPVGVYQRFRVGERSIALSRIVARTEGYTHAAEVWDLSIVQGIFCRAVPNLSVTIRNFCIAVSPWQVREDALQFFLHVPRTGGRTFHR